ncbi:BSD domain-containing protein 1-like isoform X1 [Haliotis rufescens]|uniref:BSD domain-containing protein 1-like isoform X1 n=1 Tax=Haliotis rufescens TaxID=6454 RepID=UPI00201EC1A5|nr:BSD domain-containing protein 1-like isoform X1 [Haliotis rufescens]
MADSSGASDGGSWWGGWLQAAKEKTNSAMDFVKKDLAEFTSTMQHDTTAAVKVTSTTIQDTLKAENTEAAKDKMKQSITGFFEGVSSALKIPAEDKEETVKPRDRGTAGMLYDRSKVRLHAVQVDPGTYLNEPSGPPKEFQQWLEKFNLEEQKGAISELLVVKVEVRALYTKLVPSELSHSEFWQRYFYKVFQLQQDEARKQALMKRAETPTEDDSLGWEDDWSGDECDEFETVTAGELKDIRGEDTVHSRLEPEVEVKDISSTETVESRLKAPDAESPSVKSKSDLAAEHRTPDKRTDESVSLQDVNDQKKPETEAEQDSGTSPAEVTSLQKQETKKNKVSEKLSTDIETKDLPIVQTVATDQHNVSAVTSDQQNVSSLATDHLGISALSSKSPQPSADLPQTTTQADVVKEQTTEKPSVQDKSEPTETQSSPCVELPSSPTKEAGKGDNSVVKGGDGEDLKTKVKGDLVVVGSDRESPTSDSSGNKDYLRLVPEPSVDDDWEQDFDVELTEEDLKTAEAIAKKIGTSEDVGDDDWESWE